MRTLGGSIGLSVATIVFNTAIRHSAPLKQALTSAQLGLIYKSPLALDTLPPAEKQIVAVVYSQAFTNEIKMSTYIAAVSFLVSLLTLQKNPPFKGKPGPPKAPKKGPEDDEPVEMQESPTSPKKKLRFGWKKAAKKDRPYVDLEKAALEGSAYDGFWSNQYQAF